ncbi:metal ABC transporter substrate-binding protein [Tamlana sp. 2_MG-2023]|uniref:metal ABC transporter substrate-binding protein n=1 Tax=unclassified Tamlana TaxID=2614803 RepID=UPI0026E220C1|nr:MULTISPECIES: metal ABC transporter substrate-binding protein [unclassified Tamlana]MDO6761299.1 metal ABC transporter substrate-binding protein [Tamlana sp. 2_MG-2023]MDO6791782.1 metal ABC transporter substrate-binding protein [Tamlana sp. 1_MG-2023]
MKHILLSSLLCLVLFTSCKNDKKQSETADIESNTPEKPVVYVTNYPLYYFTNRIAGKTIDLHFPASQKTFPDYWKPVADSIAAMQNADLIIINGASYEKWLMNVSIPEDKIINTSESFQDKLLASGHVFTHSHGGEGAHEHPEMASYTWQDLSLAIKQAEAIKNALMTQSEKDKTTFESNFENLKAELEQLHQVFLSTVASQPDLEIAFSHPVYQYFEAAYKIKGTSLHWEPSDNIAGDKLHEIEALQKQKDIKSIIWENTPLEASLSNLKNIGIQSIVIPPGGGKPVQGDFISQQKSNLEALKSVYITP